MHPVEGAQHSGLATAGRADEGRHVAGRNRQCHILNGMKLAVEDVDILEIEALGHEEPSLPFKSSSARKSAK
ncbi:Uncharacterised protein [Mycobacteroides abscessus subsp. abscessus]|nr:Uncharacterised protein [Mycobacteroides abscessus subsp. abscessus]